VSVESSKHIETCLKNGALNKISILPNGKIKDFKNKLSDSDPLLSLHINLVEGKSLSVPDKNSLLIDEYGYFKLSFGEIFLLSLSNKRKELKKQLYEEIKAQLLFWKSHSKEGNKIAIDSHQHIHMIPLVFKTLMDVIKDEEISVDYLRIPAEPIMPYLINPSLYLTYSPLNLIKQWLLKFFALINKKEFKNSKIKTAYFMGILFSGRMDEKRVRKVLVHYIKLAEKNGKNIEMLFHPGYIETDEELYCDMKKSFNKFYLSKGRKIEFDTIINLKNSISKNERRVQKCLTLKEKRLTKKQEKN